jgi:hypothetical protein
MDEEKWFSFENYKWADAAYWTRVLAVPDLDGLNEATSIIPLLDFCNHRCVDL